LKRAAKLMDAIYSSETSDHTAATQHHFPKDGILHSHRHENLKSYTLRIRPRSISRRTRLATDLVFARDTSLLPFTFSTMYRGTRPVNTAHNCDTERKEINIFAVRLYQVLKLVVYRFNCQEVCDMVGIHIHKFQRCIYLYSWSKCFTFLLADVPMERFLNFNTNYNLHNKLTLYKQAIRPVWSYGIQLWGCASDSNIQVIRRYNNKVLKCIVNALWYVRNCDHRDLGIETVTDIIAKFAKSHEKRLHDHINTEASRLLNVNNITRRLKRK
jgi:uncharacterized protein YeeX (DUF496 family)